MHNANPWRDIPTTDEWKVLMRNALRPTPLNRPRGRVTRKSTPHQWLKYVEHQIIQYHSIAKDRFTLFPNRTCALDQIAWGCQEYARRIHVDYATRDKPASGKHRGCDLSVWIRSVGRRARKKRGYLSQMFAWHQTAKPQYRNRSGLAAYLLAKADNRRRSGRLLAPVPYAKLEKMDPFHRQAFIWVIGEGQVVTAPPTKEHPHTLGLALIEYLNGETPQDGWHARNPDASFYEWLEYSRFCIGTPGLTGHADEFKTGRALRRARYPDDGRPPHDVFCAVMRPYSLRGCRLGSSVEHADCRPLCTHTHIKRSSKGPAGAAAFVWTAHGHLFLFQHTDEDSYTHASVTGGRAVRCAGMMIVRNGIVRHVSDESGHYQTRVQSIYYFCVWLRNFGVLPNDAVIDVGFSTEPSVRAGPYPAATFIDTVSRIPTYPRPEPVPYWSPLPAHGRVPGYTPL